MPTQVLTVEQKQFIVASNMEGVTDGEVVDSFLELKTNQYAQAPIGTPRLATKGNGTNLYGTVPAWASTNWEIEFDIIFPTTLSADKKILDGDVTGVNKLDFATNTGSKITFGAVVTSCTMDGVAVTTNTITHPVDGAAHHIKLTGTVAVSVGTILTRYSRDQKWSSSTLFNLRLTDLDTPENSRFYPMDGDGNSSVIVDTSENTQHGTWYNRTSGDVVTVYPDAIKPGEEFYVAIKYKVTDVSKNGGYNNLFSIGRRASGAYSCISLYLPESNGKFYVDPYNGTARTTGSGISGKDMGTTHLDGLTHIAVVRLKTDGSYEFWVDADTPKYTGVPNSQLAYAMDVINLNGYANATTGSVSRMGINFHYVFIYNSLDPSDIPYILQGDNPALFGEVRQGYLLNGDTSEILNQEPLTLYPVEDPPSFQDVVRNLIKSWFMNMMGWIT